MAKQGISMPSGMGGLTRFNEEYNSRFKITPAQVVGLIIGVVVFVAVLKIFFPII